MFITKKVVDIEIKSDQIQSLIDEILFDKIEIGDNFLIETPSLIVNHSKFIASNLAQVVKSFKLPSMCNLTNEFVCKNNKTILLKVN
jgi:hypothetical protein